MLLKKAEYETRTVTERVEVSPDIYGCDECRKEVELKFFGTLEICVYEGVHTHKFYFCSWDCVFKYLPKVETEDFISLPYVNYSSKGLQGSKRFLELIKKAVTK